MPIGGIRFNLASSIPIEVNIQRAEYRLEFRLVGTLQRPQKLAPFKFPSPLLKFLNPLHLSHVNPRSGNQGGDNHQGHYQEPPLLHEQFLLNRHFPNDPWPATIEKGSVRFSFVIGAEHRIYRAT